eukprot:gene34372-41605_t
MHNEALCLVSTLYPSIQQAYVIHLSNQGILFATFSVVYRSFCVNALEIITPTYPAKTAAERPATAGGFFFEMTD